ncbi:hypothetical protein T03_9819 [Trichinella britovi]|uniref:Uncharacterized protein n=1 Tax=Trichinella britovi TaxID=45882 RepID=A0A0V0Z0T0_TRIBR|nr:hypothetical protein T03_9819 [Trichinella britovi]
MRVRLPRINRQPELALSTHNHKYIAATVTMNAGTDAQESGSDQTNF